MESDIYKWRKMQTRTYNYKYRRHARRSALTNLSFNLCSKIFSSDARCMEAAASGGFLVGLGA